jgi:26S proteasome regulatory subunit T6
MNQQVKSLRDEIRSLHEPAFYVGEFIKMVGKDKALVKMSSEGKYIVSIHKDIDKTELKINARVALKKSSYEITRILP